MLGKLLKYEFKATGRILLPLYAVLLVLSLLMHLSVTSSFDKIPWGSWYGVVQGLITMLYGCTFAVVLVVTVLLLVQRFYKNLLRDEGYLMNTLPVKPWQNVAAKLLPAIVWSIIGILMAALSVMILGMDRLDWWAFFHDCQQIMTELDMRYGSDVIVLAIEGIIFVLAALAQSIMSVYLALAIGHLANKVRLLWSVVAYIGISVVEYLGAMMIARIEQGTHLLSDFANYLLNEAGAGNPMLLTHATINGLNLVNILLCVVMFVATAYILKRHLNLE